MKYIIIGLLLASTQAVSLRLRNDDTDELLEGMITNKAVQAKSVKFQGPVDTLVAEAVQEAKDQYHTDSFVQKKRRVVETRPLSDADQWKKLMQEPDPLAETDIYATIKSEKPEQTVYVDAGDPEDTEMQDELTEALEKSFHTEKKHANFVQDVPVLLQQKQQQNYNNLF
mmetsp:Transcript_22265/g.34442  ORF Transcript_22265/g.34442 Transcript_22265/m.34442 type:complete len:170 (-) Transcript_22265:17-526(-)